MAKVCTTHNVASIEAMPCIKGYLEAQTFWRQFFDGITALRRARHDGHRRLRTASRADAWKDPTLPAYDRHGLKLHKRPSALAEEFADVVLYAAMQTNTITEDSGSTTSAPPPPRAKCVICTRSVSRRSLPQSVTRFLAAAADLGSVPPSAMQPDAPVLKAA